MLHALIMAGGAGTRFWPASRRGSPKQVLALAGRQSMIQATLARLKGLVPASQVMVMTSAVLVERIRSELAELPAAAVIGEPCKRDTAPCIGLTALWLSRRDPQATMLVMPADHVIEPLEQFQAAIRYGAKLIEDEPSRIVTYGIRPTYPAESFGYIERGEVLQAARSAPAAYRVAHFREKPAAAVARDYLARGGFYWNSGIFLWKASTICDALREREPEMFAHLQKIADAADTAKAREVFDTEFSAIRAKSIDYAVMEHARDVVVIEAPFSWDDVGSWQSLARICGTDAAGNAVVGKHLGLETSGCVIRTSDDHLIATLDVKDLIVVHTPDVTLVANKASEEAIRQLVLKLEAEGRDELL